MLVEGKYIARELLAKVATDVVTLGRMPTLAALTCAPNFETKKYLEMKKRTAAKVGISLSVIELPADSQTSDVEASIARIVSDVDGIVVQLPLPAGVDREAVLSAVPREKDPDGFQYAGDTTTCLPPVVGAIDEIAKYYQVTWEGARVVVLGQGRLVGRPAAIYARGKSAEVVVLDKENFNVAVVRQADILITGIGQPQFVTKDMVQPGVVVFDAGTSEDGGVLVGDVHGDVAECARLITPVPGGIGPITIAYLLKNLLDLSGRQ
jgi:methylenetetrahydrofolate dehydrogenase (NADP+)/methenyltetrahydrofolate cyclohydrolase